VTYSETGENSIEIPAHDSNNVGPYNIEFTAVIGSDIEIRSLYLVFDIISCEID
jgi:hypothetical protein